ncbi:sensor histidine kinase [bacterium C-53]|nr:sensor histidine kinase [Lachnospiraceae bacterium]NBI04469.1 sensor histidine kinase [Lachnospiraceae bacterium]RKJ08142.1 sensor histidine kinase [bacterium C-53]
MKLRTRLIITFLVIVILPIFLICITFFGIGQYQIKAVEKAFGIEGDIYDLLSNSVKVYSKGTAKIYDKMQEDLKEDPTCFEQKDYLQSINEKLIDKSSVLIVMKDGSIFYSGSEENIDLVKNILPDFDKDDSEGGREMYIREKQLLIKQINFSFSDGADGDVYIVTQVSDMIPQIKSTMFQMIIATVLTLIFTGIALVSWIYNGLVSPLRLLSEATQKIAEGNLDFTMDLSGHAEEIDNLCSNFEDMRRRLKETAEEKVQYDNENRALISNITHDLKTPVTAIKGYAEGIMDGVADTPEKQEKYIRTIYSKANDMDRLINELTFYSGIDANRIPYNFTKIHIADYFSDCVEEMAMDLESKNIEMIFENQLAKDTVVIADPVQMKKVVNNIIGNSAKYIDKSKGIIKIKIKDAEEFVIIEIEDNGRGIAAKDLPYIFDRFYRTDISRNSSKGGSGIGLSIVKKVLEDHGGRIWAASKVGEGTTMIMELRKYEEVAVNE